MVVLNEVKNMFWGVTLDGGKRYSQTVEHSFHISMAALELKTDDGDKKKQGNVAVMIQHDKAEFLLCTLNDKIPQSPLDLNLSEGEDVTFFLNGTGVVHLTGYLLDDSAYDSDLPDEGLLEGEDVSSDEESDDDSDDEDNDDEDDDDDEEQVPKLLGELDDDEDSEDDDDYSPEMAMLGDKKRKKKSDMALVPAKKMKQVISELCLDEDDDDEDDESFDMDETLDDEEMDSDDEDDDEDDSDEDDDSDDEDESDDEIPPALAQKVKTPKSEKKGAVESPTKSDKAKTPNVKHDKPQTPKQKNPKQETPKNNQGKGSPKNAQDTPKGKKDTPKPKAETPKAKVDQAVTQNGATPSSGKKKKKGKDGGLEQSTPAKTNQNEDKTKQQSPKSEKKKQKNEATPGKKVKKTLPGGTTVEVLSDGHGPEAKVNKTVHMYYRGTLKDGKKFDECMSGNPFKFKLGKGEVIKGWDDAIVGMKVGGRRRIVVPPSQGYGNQRVGPIPPNSTLMFEIELKAVS